MTVLTGILCNDGVVIGADSSATMGNAVMQTVEQPVKKITTVGNEILIAGTGAVGLNQRFVEVVKTLHHAKQHEQKKPIEFAKLIAAEAIKDFVATNVQPGQYGALVAFPHGGMAHLVEFDTATMQPEFRTDNIWFGSMGSGQYIADPFLGLFRKTLCPDGPPNLATGIFISAWALSLTCELNTGGIKEPVCLSVLRKDATGNLRVSDLSEADMAEHLANVKGAEDHLSQYAAMLKGAGAAQVPKPKGK